jgi:hypothetical protein
MLGREVDPAARFWHPQLDTVVLEQRRHQRVLAPVERPLVLPDHDRLPASAGIGQQGDEHRRPRAAAPRHRPALPDVEELRHDMTVPADQRLRLLPLPRPRRLGGPASPRSTPARKTRTAARRPPGPGAVGGPTPPPTPPDRPHAQPGRSPVSPQALSSSSWPPPQESLTALAWYQAIQMLRISSNPPSSSAPGSTYRRRRNTVSTWKKSIARIVLASASRNAFQVCPDRPGRGIDPSVLKDLPHRRRREPVPQADHLAEDAPVSPARVIPGDLQDLRPYGLGGPGTTGGAARVGPVPPDEVGVLAQKGWRGDDQAQLAEPASGQQPGQHRTYQRGRS